MHRNQRSRNSPSRYTESKSRRDVVPHLKSGNSLDEAPLGTYSPHEYRSSTQSVHDGATINKNLNSLWVHALIEHEQALKDKRAKKEYKSLLCLPGSTLLPRATLSSLHGKDNNNHKNLLTEMKIKDSVKSTYKDNHALHDKNIHSFRRKYAPYIDANAKIRHALSLRTPFQTREELRSKQLEQFIIIIEKEVKAAVILQLYWRRYKAIQYLSTLKHEKVCVIRIQAFIRGVFVRIKWKEWKHRCHLYAIKCQAIVRRQIISRKWSSQKELERQKATIIQACIRSFLFKFEYFDCFLNRRTTKIQRLWRGYQGRYRFLKVKLCVCATAIQTTARRHLACKKYIRILKEKTEAVVEIQRCWRGHVSRRLLSELLYERSLFWRKRRILIYQSDFEYLCQKMDRARKHIHVQDPKAHTEMLNQDIQKCRQDLDSKRQVLAEEENNYLELECTKEGLTRDDIERGWLEQTENSLKDSMSRITDLKLDIVFKGLRRLKVAEEALRKHETLFAEMESEKSRLLLSIEKSTNDYWDFQRVHDQKKQRTLQRQNIADEKRKWKVQALSASGKPLKKKQSPTSIHTAIKEEKASGLMGIASVDLFAHYHAKDNSSTGDRIDELIEQVKLSLNRNQTLQYHSTLGMVERMFSQCHTHLSEL